jgi:hypothetical protein
MLWGAVAAVVGVVAVVVVVVVVAEKKGVNSRINLVARPYAMCNKYALLVNNKSNN